MATVQEPIKEVALTPMMKADPALVMIERFASDPAFDVSKLQALMDMREREINRIAEQEFNVAMSKAQGKMRAVAPDKHNSQTKSEYASYAALDRMARPIYTEFGFGLSFDSQKSELVDHVLVLCYVSHDAGFSRTYRVDMPADGKGAKGGDVMTKTHAAGSAFSYAQRYLLRLIFNLAVGEDDDGNAAGAEGRSLPDGFEDWIDVLDRAATNGVQALNAAWACSENVHKNFILVTEWERIKSKAREADRA